jgi:hypothetical protein
MRGWLAAGACLLLTLTSPELPAFADTIVFQHPNMPQRGTVVGEDESSVTIRFPRTAVKSIGKSSAKSSAAANRVILEEKGGFHILKIPDHLLQIRTPAKTEDAAGAQQNSRNVQQTTPADEEKQAPTVQHQLLEEEMGGVQGTIRWQGQPLRGNVKIVLTRYTGFSFAAMLKMFSSDSASASNEKEVVLTTATDGRGHYIFPTAPPGFYRLYWQPAGEKDWIHRLRDKPDFEVVAGRTASLNIPAK